jgi:hypothetical protein
VLSLTQLLILEVCSRSTACSWEASLSFTTGLCVSHLGCSIAYTWNGVDLILVLATLGGEMWGFIASVLLAAGDLTVWVVGVYMLGKDRVSQASGKVPKAS